jgi:hypothetical protein
METPKGLERQVHRIHELLMRSPDEVTWNDRIPDPDNRASQLTRRPVGIEAGELIIEFGRDKVVFPVTSTGEHFTLHFGPDSGVLDFHRTWTSPKGLKRRETLFAIRYTDLSAIIAEFVPLTFEMRRLLPRSGRFCAYRCEQRRRSACRPAIRFDHDQWHSSSELDCPSSTASRVHSRPYVDATLLGHIHATHRRCSIRVFFSFIRPGHRCYGYSL